MGFTRGLTIAAALLALAAGAEAQQRQRRLVTEEERQQANAALDAFTAPTLTRFGSEAELRNYVEAVRQFQRTRGRYRYSARSVPRFAQAAMPGGAAQSDADAPLCPPDQPECLEDEGDEQVIVTGSRVPPPSNPSITNNQLRSVEEGDIVKQIGQFLLVLQDGRIFVVDTRAGGGRDLALADRADVYRDPQSDMWYDEMLVFGDRVLITGYSYDEAASELAVFRLGETGRLIREGVFRIASGDYYSGGNYATRLIDGNLVTYSPLQVSDIAGENFRWPVVRRWLPEDDARERAYQTRRRQNWRLRRDPQPAGLPPLIDAAGIYRPVRRIEEPVVHSVSVCPLASSDGGRDLRCRTTSFVAPEWPEWYVTETHVYLWTTTRDYGRDCDGQLSVADSASALVYRVPHSGARPDVIAAHGMPPDQFAIQADARRLYALVRLVGPGCAQRYDEPTQLAFFSLPLARFGPTLAEAPLSAFTEMPGTPTYSVASRFTDRYLVYGGLSGYRRYPNLADHERYSGDYRRRVIEQLRPRPAYVVPIGRPEAFRPLTIGHTVIRAERVADDILMTGYRDGRGLSLTLIGLDGRPRIASTAFLAGRYESEGRSHAFNSLIESDGSGVMGLPTVRQITDSDRERWRSRASDLSFLALDARRRLRPVGELERRFDYVDDFVDFGEDEDGVPGYQCEVSCIDWYGNSRPIFTDGRIYGLSGTELIEGRIQSGRIVEVQRINIALTPPPRP